MRDQYVEVLVKRTLPETQKLKTIVLSMALLLFVIGIIFSMPIIYVVALVLMLIYYFKILRMDCEYEYFYMDGGFDVSVIYNKAKRKKVISVKDSEIELIAPVNSQEMDVYNHLKSIDCTAKEGTDKTHAIVCRCNNKCIKILIQPNAELLKAFKVQIPIKVKE